MSTHDEMNLIYTPEDDDRYTVELIDHLLIEPLRADLITQLDGRLIKQTPAVIYTCFENHTALSDDYWPETSFGIIGFPNAIREPQSMVRESLEILLRAPGMETYGDVLDLMRTLVVNEMNAIMESHQADAAVKEADNA